MGAYLDTVIFRGEAGSAYVFERNQGGVDNWGEMKKLLAGDRAVGDWFGLTVGVSGDRAIVGASRDDDQGGDSGSAYVFEQNQGGVSNWGQVQKLTASDGAAQAAFGISVAISADTIVVGSQLIVVTGSAYVFGVPAIPRPRTQAPTRPRAKR